MKSQFCLRILCLICCFVDQTNFSKAQGDESVFAPIGATWYYSPAHFGPPWITDPLRAFFLVEKDTFMLGYDARVIGCYVNDNNQMLRVDSLTRYVATIGDQVFYKVEDEFVLLFDFGAQAGDTIHSKVDEFGLEIGCGSDFSNGVIDFSYVVDSVGLQYTDGEELRVLYVHSIDQSPDPDWVFWEPIVERIGPMSFGAFWWGRGQGCIFESGYLRCYIDDDINWRSSYFDDQLPCDYISSANQIQYPRYRLYPNPAETNIYLPQAAVHVGLWDIMGRSFQISILGNEIDVSTYPPGMYILRFELEGIMRASSFVKN